MEKNRMHRCYSDISSDRLSVAQRSRLVLSRKTVNEWQAQWREWKWMNERAKIGASYEPTLVEHYANTISHGIMILPSILAGELLLISSKCEQPDLLAGNNTLPMINSTHTIHYEVSARVYGISLVSLFLVSTIFHWVTWCKAHHPVKALKLSDNCCESPLWKFLHVCDRGIIFLFISGSYTPWLMLSPIHSSMEWLRWGVWVFAILGIAYSLFLLEKYKLLETLLYVAQGLLPALAIANTAERAHLNNLSLGGLFYLSGVLIFKSDGHIPCAHAIWHLFVAAGALSHFLACYTALY